MHKNPAHSATTADLSLSDDLLGIWEMNDGENSYYPHPGWKWSEPMDDAEPWAISS
jgi:hypothetical protein